MKIRTLLMDTLSFAFMSKAIQSEKATKKKQQRIRCPICGWQPDGKPYWACEKCFATFDTFKTHAHCPTCDNSWHYTQCIACHKQSPHDKWYEN